MRVKPSNNTYHAEVGIMKQITAAKTVGVVAITLPSETIFSYELKTNYAFGIPVSVSAGGLAMDADRLISLVKALDGNKEKPIQFLLDSGADGSALEHSVPEQLFSTTENPAQGISAVKALKIANDQGIPIYSINQSNINTILPQLQLDGDVKSDIQNAVNAGKSATVSKTNINFNGWIGCGYIIIDPTTGDGAYMISGGKSGSFQVLMRLLAALAIVLSIYTFIAMAVALTAGAPIVALISAIITGLLIGFAGSQLLSKDFKEFLAQTITDPEVIGLIVGILIAVAAPPLLIIIVFIVLIAFAVIQQFSYNYDETPGYILRKMCA